MTPREALQILAMRGMDQLDSRRALDGGEPLALLEHSPPRGVRISLGHRIEEGLNGGQHGLFLGGLSRKRGSEGEHRDEQH